MASASDLRCRVEVLKRTETVNDLGEQDYAYVPEQKIWAQIVPLSGRTVELEGDMERVEVSHRITVRRSSLPKLTTDLRLRFRGQIYTVQYFYPNYKSSGWLDLFCRLEVEDGIQSF